MFYAKKIPFFWQDNECISWLDELRMFFCSIFPNKKRGEKCGCVRFYESIAEIEMKRKMEMMEGMNYTSFCLFTKYIYKINIFSIAEFS